MTKQVVPDVGSNFKVSIPVPDMLYGYSREGAFTDEQQTLLLSMGLEMVANSDDVLYPFFYVEFKADGPTGSGSLWVGTNQCLGGSASCVNIVDRLNRRLRYFKDNNFPMTNNTVFSITMSGTEARIYVSWKHDEFKYYMAKVDSFLLQRPEHFIDFRKIVLNIIEWGKKKHLEEIRKSLYNLVEAKRRITLKLAKCRPSPVEDIISSSHARREKESRKQTMPAANEMSTTVVPEPSSLDSSKYHPLSDIDAISAGGSYTSVEEVEGPHSYD